MFGNNICCHPDDNLLRVSLIIPAGLPSHKLSGLEEKQCSIQTGLAAIQAVPLVRYQSLTSAFNFFFFTLDLVWNHSFFLSFYSSSFLSKILETF